MVEIEFFLERICVIESVLYLEEFFFFRKCKVVVKIKERDNKLIDSGVCF